MLIRTQNKDELVNVSCVIRFSIWEKSVYADFPFADVDNDCTLLGSYFSDEQAMRVLDMIQIAYEESVRTVDSYSSSHGMVPRPIFSNKVYQMPQEGEVL